MLTKVKKYDRVEFKNNGKLVVGTVFKGGSSKAHVVVDGMKQEYSVPVGMLAPTKVPAPKDAPSKLDRWGVSGYREAGGEETVCFECYITLDGKRVLHARNDGNGGCNFYSSLKDRKALGELEADVKAFIAANGGGYDFEVVDFWLTWRAEFCRFQTFAQYLDDSRKQSEQYRLQSAK